MAGHGPNWEDDPLNQAGPFIGILLGWCVGLIAGILLGNYLGASSSDTLYITAAAVSGAAFVAFYRLQEASNSLQTQESPPESSQLQPQSHCEPREGE